VLSNERKTNIRGSMLLDASSAIIPNAASAAETPGYAGSVLCKRHSPDRVVEIKCGHPG
jgi:hypothetical protein